LNESEADFAAPRMHSAQLPLEALADEFGAAAGRIERELRLKDEARAARFEARLAAIELAAFKAEEDRQRKFEARMAELRDGKDGEPGKDGKDADISHIEQQFGMQKEHVFKWLSEVEIAVNDRLASLKDGKDGEPGKDGKNGADADTRLILMTLDEMQEGKFAGLVEKVDARLAEIKDGEDGEPGKCADIGPLVKDVEEMKERVWEQFQAYNELYSEQIETKLAEVVDGKDGKDGEQGPPGKDGKDGQDGKMPIVREWTNRVHYAGDIVRHAGATYQALADTGREPPHGDWGELASRGTDGRGFVLRGMYDATAEYRQHDIVMINRNSFAAKYDAPGECPGDGWQLFGPSGNRGKEGPPGSPGPKGVDGRLVSITKWEADPDEMVLRIADSTGNTFTVDLQPIAERILEAAR
jgi:hypothetical protein